MPSTPTRSSSPAGKKAHAPCCGRARSGLTMRVLPFARDRRGDRGSRGRARRGSQIALPAGRSLLVVARAQGAGPYTLALSRR